MDSNTKTILTQDTIQRLMQAHFGPDARVTEATMLTQGWFNAVYIVRFDENGAAGHRALVLKTGVEDGKYVLSYERDIMRAEVLVYDRLSATDVPVPEILVRDFSRSLVACDYFIMEMLQGDNWMNLEGRITPANNEKLIAQIARYTAEAHKLKGDYFGYIREDRAYQFSTWREAFQGMVQRQIRDGRNDGVDMAYDQVLDAFEPLWPILDEVKSARLVNFDMWKKNIMLREVDGEYVIDGIIDHERSFYGDPYADFIASGTICGPVEDCPLFQENYSAVSGAPFTFTRNDARRRAMYDIYLSLLMGVEVYRYNEQDTVDMIERCARRIQAGIAALKAL